MTKGRLRENAGGPLLSVYTKAGFAFPGKRRYTDR